MNTSKPTDAAAPEVAALSDLADARRMIAASKATLQMVRRRKLPKQDAKIVYDQCIRGSQFANFLAGLSECAPWRGAFERTAHEIHELREQASTLMPPTSKNESRGAAPCHQ